MDFIYSNTLQPYLPDMKADISTLECKHILIKQDHPQMYELSLAAGYPGCIWGYCIGGTSMEK